MTELKNAFNYLYEIKQKASNSGKAFLFLDYDGTLTEIVANPDNAIPPPELSGIFNSFKGSNFIISIVSGRHLKDLEKLLKNINTSGINLIGSHGFEVLLAGKNKTKNSSLNLHTEELEFLKKIKIEIKKYYSGIDNIFIEDKPYSFAIHYRNVPEGQLGIIKKITGFLDARKKVNKFKYLKMKKVIEVMPSQMDKGSIIAVIINYYSDNKDDTDILDKQKTGKHFVICIGDDTTDEDLFDKNRQGINIKVTKNTDCSKTRAEYYLKNPHDVLLFIENIMKPL